jgi:hypothetical protein
MSDSRYAAEHFALQVWDFLADTHHADGVVTDEQQAAIRKDAFQFSRNVECSDIWQVTHGRRLAHAVLAWADDPTSENFKALGHASRRYEEFRLAPPTE